MQVDRDDFRAGRQANRKPTIERAARATLKVATRVSIKRFVRRNGLVKNESDKNKKLKCIGSADSAHMHWSNSEPCDCHNELFFNDRSHGIDTFAVGKRRMIVLWLAYV